MNVVRDRLSPMTQPARLIVIVAFSRADNGELVPACCPMLFDTPEEILRVARYLAARDAGGLAWSRDAHADIGAYGTPTILFHSGAVPEVE
jgi:hypothetical protein